MNKRTYLTAIALLSGAVGLPKLARAQTSTGVPQGFACGLSYYDGNVCGGTAFSCSIAWAFPATMTYDNNHGVCNITKNQLSGFVSRADGDWGGQPTGFGFYHFGSSVANSTPSAQYLLPKGTVCGLKEQANDPSVTCMGWDSNVSCGPSNSGWKQKFRNDSGGPNGTGRWVWCEYQDPNNLCTTRDCYLTQQPLGTVCGASDTDRVYPGNAGGGQCMGLSPSIAHCSSLGYNYFAHDENAPNGSGLGYCIK
jgi:hypothetical protein